MGHSRFMGYHSQWFLLSGNQSKFQPFVKNGTLIIKQDNLPDIVAIGGKVYIPHLAALKVHFQGRINNSDSVADHKIYQDDVTPSLSSKTSKWMDAMLERLFPQITWLTVSLI